MGRFVDRIVSDAIRSPVTHLLMSFTLRTPIFNIITCFKFTSIIPR